MDFGPENSQRGRCADKVAFRTIRKWVCWGREGPQGELKFCSCPRFLGSSSPREHRSDLFQHLTFNHDKTVGKLIVLRDIKHQTPLILSERDAGCILIGRVPGRRGVFFLPTEAPPTPGTPPFSVSPGCGC